MEVNKGTVNIFFKEFHGESQVQNHTCLLFLFKDSPKKCFLYVPLFSNVIDLDPC